MTEDQMDAMTYALASLPKGGNPKGGALTGHAPFSTRARAQHVHGVVTGGQPVVKVAPGVTAVLEELSAYTYMAPTPHERVVEAARRADQPELHTEAGHDAITAELVACTLGARRRPELEVGMVASLNRAFGGVRDALAPFARLFAAPPSRTAHLRAWLAR